MREIDIITNVFKLVHKKMDYKDDQKTQGQTEHWKDWSLDPEFTDSKKVYDDCDGYAITFASLLAKEGIPKSNIGISFCKIEDPATRGKWGGHLVCIVKDSVNDYWYVLDNNIHRPHKVREYPFKVEWVSFMMLNAPGANNWVKSPPWKEN